MRRIDLIVNIVAPIAVGAILSVSLLIGGIFIAAWNAVSMAVEYWNLYRVYTNLPELAIKGGVEFTGDFTLMIYDCSYADMTCAPVVIGTCTLL